MSHCASFSGAGQPFSRHGTSLALDVISSRFQELSSMLAEAMGSSFPAPGFDCDKWAVDTIRQDMDGLLFIAGWKELRASMELR